MEPKNTFSLRRLKEDEAIPYHLLLLADETTEAINKYVFESEIYVYELNAELIAIYVLKIIDHASAEIKNIAVDTDFQGKGIGSYLLESAAKNMKERGFKSLLIGTGDNSVKQLELYQHNGFKKFKVIKKFFIDNYPEPIYENGKQLKDMILLKREL